MESNIKKSCDIFGDDCVYGWISDCIKFDDGDCFFQQVRRCCFRYLNQMRDNRIVQSFFFVYILLDIEYLLFIKNNKIE